jgi:hypothetical protein
MTSQFGSRFGPWAVVTGASAGIGAAFARELAARGLHVVLVARRTAELTALGDELARSHGVQTRVLALDLGAATAAATLLQRTADLEVGLVVAAAGFGSCGPLLEQEAEAEAAMVDVNCRAVLQLVHGFGRRLCQQRRGALVLLSSLVAFQGAPFAANYAATKAYVQALAEAVQREFAAHGVQVIACAPGPVHTEFAARARMTMGSALRPEVVARETLARLPRGGTVRPGFGRKLLGLCLAMLPRAMRVRVLGKVMAGFAQGAAR